jgi:hypothetical protein
MFPFGPILHYVVKFTLQITRRRHAARAPDLGSLLAMPCPAMMPRRPAMVVYRPNGPLSTTYYVPFRLFLGDADVRREVQRLSVALHGTWGSYLRDAL